jgi:predicted Rossmann fold flavoprotein
MRRVVVVGAGAAGMMAAIFAAEAGAETTLLDRTSDGGRKILISGGGRCNILPSRVDYSRFVSDASPQLVRRIGRSWPLEAQIAFFERDANLPLFEEPASAKLFPRSQSGRHVRDTLLALVRAKGASFLGASSVIDLWPTIDGWRVERQRESPLEADAVVLATGGLSVPSTGSDGHGLEIARRLGHTVNPTYPALTPLTGAAFAHLSGISLPVTATAHSINRSASATGGFLFTHRGYSGPSVLDVSHVAVRSREEGVPAEIRVRWSALGPEQWDRLLRASGTQTVVAAISRPLPNRLAEALIKEAHVECSRTLAQLTRAERLRLVDTLVNGRLPWDGDEGYRKAEVTGGGVSLDEIDPGTMESRRHRGLFLCGEMLDAFGPIGGYNFLWAWATGRAAGIAAARPLPQR